MTLDLARVEIMSLTIGAGSWMVLYITLSSPVSKYLVIDDPVNRTRLSITSSHSSSSNIMQDSKCSHNMTGNNPAKSLALKQKGTANHQKKSGGGQKGAGSTQVMTEILLEVENTKSPAPPKLLPPK